RNKAKKAVEIADLIHSLDSVRIARKASDEALASGIVVEGLVQVNVAGEATKGGLGEAEALDGIGEICSLGGLRIVGLMTMAPFTDDERVVRPVFERARLLAEQAARVVSGFEPRHLSMGMSG